MEWYLVALLSAFFSACAAILEKKILFKEKALSMSFILALFNLVLAVPFFFFIDYSLLSFVSLGVLFFKSVLGAFAFLLIMKGIKSLEISKALPLLVLTPGFVAFFAWIFLGESLKLIEIGGMGLLLVGTYVLQIERGRGFLAPVKAFVKTKEHYYIFGALILFATTSVLDKALLSNYKVPLDAFFGFQHLFFALVFLVLAIVYSNKSELKNSFKFSWKMIGVLAVITIVYRYAHLYAVKAAPVALVLSIKRISVFFAVLIGGRLFQDRSLWRRVVATGLMVLGAVLIIMS